MLNAKGAATLNLTIATTGASGSVFLRQLILVI